LKTTSITIFCSLLLACSAWADAASGLLTLPLLNKNFPVEDAARILKASPRPAFGFLHGSFGKEYQNLHRLQDMLGKRRMTIVVYADCGPCRPPRRPKGHFPLIASSLDIRTHNRLIGGNNRNLIHKYRAVYWNIKEQLRQQRNIRYRFQISLEDNLTEEAHSVLRLIALDVFKDRPDVIVGRNPLKFSQAPYPVEYHGWNPADLYKLKAGDIMTTDGFPMVYRNDEWCPSMLKPRVARDLVVQGRIRGVITMIWTPQSQGLPFCFPGAPKMKDREYWFVPPDFVEIRNILRR